MWIIRTIQFRLAAKSSLKISLRPQMPSSNSTKFKAKIKVSWFLRRKRRYPAVKGMKVNPMQIHPKKTIKTKHQYGI